MLSAGSRIGPYEIASLLGSGGMGEVYRARDARLGRTVALKVLPPDVAGDPGRRQRFEQEARAASALNHPNIISVYDIGSQDGLVYIVSELIDGETLRDLLKHGPLPQSRVVEIAGQVAEALAAAHAGTIVHRDLKPENIMLTRDGRAKILDFGLAKQVTQRTPGSDETELVTRTTPGAVLGTAGYMSPEQVRGEAVDGRSDIFSFGLVLYECLAGQPPFERPTSVELMTAILREDPPELPETVVPALRQIVSHCLEKEPDRRFRLGARPGLCAAHRQPLGDRFTHERTDARLAGPAAKVAVARCDMLPGRAAGRSCHSTLLGTGPYRPRGLSVHTVCQRSRARKRSRVESRTARASRTSRLSTACRSSWCARSIPPSPSS